MSLIQLQGVWHHYQQEGEDLPALAGIDLEIQAGEYVAVVGHNGSGKSTLARHLNALLLPDQGVVRVCGFETSQKDKVWEIRRRVGMVFQNPDNQIVATSVAEDVAFGPENLGIDPKEIRSRVEWALRQMGMEAYAEHPPDQLSGGQKQRVAIAGVLAMRPQVLVLDEATAMLDPQGREEVLEAVGRLNQEEGITVVLITHFMEEAALADRVLMMEMGRVVLDGPPRRVFSQVETIERLGLDLPQMAILAGILRQRGLQLSEGILTVEEMVNALCRS